MALLDKFLDPEYADKLALSKAAKAEIIMAGEKSNPRPLQNTIELPQITSMRWKMFINF